MSEVFGVMDDMMVVERMFKQAGVLDTFSKINGELDLLRSCARLQHRYMVCYFSQILLLKRKT